MKDHHLNLVRLLDTSVKSNKATSIAQSIVPGWNMLHNSSKADNGTIWVLWDDNVYQVEVIAQGAQYLHSQTTKPWLIWGDFNALLKSQDRVHGAPVTRAEIQDFATCMHDLSLNKLAWKGGQLVEPEAIQREILTFYQALMGTSLLNIIAVNLATMKNGPPLTHQQKVELCVDVTDQEIYTGLYSIGNDKAPGVDGYNTKFFKKNVANDQLGADSEGPLPQTSKGDCSSHLTNSSRIYTSSGLRQGDPMSPFLFAIVIKYLSRSLKELEQQRDFNNHPLCKKLHLTHLSFADDLLLFARGDINSVKLLHEKFITFTEASGLQVNHAKSVVYFGGVTDEVKVQIQQNLGHNTTRKISSIWGAGILGAIIHHPYKRDESYSGLLQKLYLVRPKAIFIVWLQVQNRLLTVDRLLKWNKQVDPVCVM
ncbi:hypothetical protein FXO38_10995 [Capsicum annuum]|nr:hypothetical protein FXO38_10995 [Capsicum annuum]